ncbi:MAG TPA: hypothetical protein VF469_04250 [Kofleriaceae bacterium]
MRIARFAFTLALVACGGSSGSPPAPDAPAGPACTGAIYDTCTTNDQCMSMSCHSYTGAGLQVCTQACNATNMPCPNDAAGQPVACNTMGNCKPSVANTCHR